MSGWMRYPDRLAHLVHDGPGEPIDHPTEKVEWMGEAPKPLRIGTLWRTRCSRELRAFYDTDKRPWSAEWVDPVELRAEVPRSWCLRCAYWAALDALVIEERSYTAFVDAIGRGALPGLVPARAGS